jgi:TetR/AcrR family transcriptional regulator, transcriptional repressor of aconitase
MNTKRLTRRESQEQTRVKLLESAEKLFARDGFDATPVERIAAEAGFTRGAFYSNFADKDELFLELLDRRRQNTHSSLDAIFRETLDAGDRFRVAREWYGDHWRRQQWTILRTEFHLRALRNKTVAKRLSRLFEQELEEIAAVLSRYYAEAGMEPAGDPRVEALSLYAMSYGLGLLSAFSPGKEMEASVAAARVLAYDRLVAAPTAKRPRGKQKNA